MEGEPSTDGSTERAELHALVERAVGPLRPLESTLRNGISSHVVASAVTLTQLDAMQQSASQLQRQRLHTPGPRLFFYVGSMDGKLRISARVGATALTAAANADDGAGVGTKKRSRSTPSEDQAEAVVAGVRRRLGAPLSSACAAHLEAGRRIVEQLIALTGAADERAVQAVGMHLSDVGGGSTAAPSSTAASTPSSGGRLMLSARLATGVAIPLARLRAAVRACTDGALTTTANGLGDVFPVPTPLAPGGGGDGGVGLLLHVVVPMPEASAVVAGSAAPSMASRGA